MRLFPSVDILDGKAVRLLHGDRNKVTVYGDPYAVVKGYLESGAEIVHIVDLNGAFDGTEVNDAILKKIRELPLKMQLGGGIRSCRRAEYVLKNLGYNRIVLGSICVTDTKLVQSLCAQFGNQIVGCLDTKDGKVAIKGWKENSEYAPLELAFQLKSFGITDLVFTDISRDGAMVGVNVDLTAELQKSSGMNIIASGGVKDIADIEKLQKKGVYGAILGKALYTGGICLEEALKRCTQNV